MKGKFFGLIPVARIILGLIFFIFGLNGFIQFIPVPSLAESGERFIQDLIHTGYMLPLWKGTEVLGGLLLLVNRWVGLAIVILAPVVLNIFFFHVFLDPGNIALGLIVMVLELFLAWGYHRQFKSILQWKVSPSPRMGGSGPDKN